MLLDDIIRQLDISSDREVVLLYFPCFFNVYLGLSQVASVMEGNLAFGVRNLENVGAATWLAGSGWQLDWGSGEV